MLLSCCSQGSSGTAVLPTPSPTTAASPSPSPNPGATPTATTPSPAAGAPSPLPGGGYATAIDAAVAAAMAMTGFPYAPGFLSCSQPICVTPPGNCSGGSYCVFGDTNPSDGLDAAAVNVNVVGQVASTAWMYCWVYVYYQSGEWRSFTSLACPAKDLHYPRPNVWTHVNAPGTCGNVRAAPSTTVRIVTCIKDGTPVAIDYDLPQPRYVDGHIWWSVNQHQGWMALDVLLTA